MSDLLHNPTLWVIVSFAGFILLVLKLGVHHKLTAALDQRAEAIRHELDTARKLRREAEAVLVDYKAKHTAHMKDAKAMLERAEAEAEALRVKTQEEMNAMLDARMNAAMARIEQQEKQAISEVRDHVVDITIAAAREMVAQRFNALSSRQMVDLLVRDMESKTYH